VRYGNAQRSSLCKRYHWHRCYFLNAWGKYRIRISAIWMPDWVYVLLKAWQTFLNLTQLGRTGVSLFYYMLFSFLFLIVCVCIWQINCCLSPHLTEHCTKNVYCTFGSLYGKQPACLEHMSLLQQYR
jgi:hypothetical protein